MSLLRSINANQLLGNSKVAVIVGGVGCGIAVVVTALPVAAETVGVLDPEVKARVTADKLRETDKRRGHVVESQPLVYVFI